MATTPRKFPPKGKVGTPRGYVNKEARDKVDEAMEPVATVGKAIITMTPGLGAARGAKAAYTAAKLSGAVDALGASSIGAGIAGAYEAASNYYNKNKRKLATDKSRLNKGSR